MAGSNGAGKTTFYELYLERLGLPFVNADRIAQVLNPAQPELEAYQGAKVGKRMGNTPLLSGRRRLPSMRQQFLEPAGGLCG